MKQRITQLIPTSPQHRLGLWIYLATSIVAASCLIAGYFGLQPTVQRWLLERWENQLSELDSTTAPAVMADAATQGDWGLQLLLVGTLSSHEVAQQAACRELELHLERWSHDTTDHSADVVRLAGALAGRIDRYDESQHRELRPVIQRLTQWPIDRRRADATVFVAHCETLARRVVEVRLASVIRPLPVRDLPQLFDQNAPPPPTTNVEQNLSAPNLQTPNVPFDLSTEQQPENPSAANDPELMLEKLPSTPSGIRRMPERPRASGSTTNSADRTTGESAIPRNAVMPIALERLDRLIDWEVIVKLHDPNWNPQQVEAELSRRGYRPHDLAIARRAAHPDPGVRQQLIEELPQLKGIDARLWLRQLAEDPVPAVKSRAQAMLRTVSDPTAWQTKM